MNTVTLERGQWLALVNAAGLAPFNQIAPVISEVHRQLAMPEPAAAVAVEVEPQPRPRGRPRGSNGAAAHQPDLTIPAAPEPAAADSAE